VDVKTVIARRESRDIHDKADASLLLDELHGSVHVASLRRLEAGNRHAGDIWTWCINGGRRRHGKRERKDKG